MKEIIFIGVKLYYHSITPKWTPEKTTKAQLTVSHAHTHVALPHRVAKVTENQTWQLIHCKLTQTFASNFEEFVSLCNCNSVFY